MRILNLGRWRYTPQESDGPSSTLLGYRRTWHAAMCNLITAAKWMSWIAPPLRGTILRRQLGELSFVARAIRRIIGGLDLGEPLHADGMDLRDAVLEGLALDVVGDLAVAKRPFARDKLPLLESPQEL